jgi:hypothetical protein
LASCRPTFFTRSSFFVSRSSSTTAFSYLLRGWGGERLRLGFRIVGLGFEGTESEFRVKSVGFGV